MGSIDLSRMPRLGFGLMRLPTKDGEIDLQHVCRMVDQYMEAGLNYFDTAYVYHGGFSERAVKDALCARYPREAFMLATKLPAWVLRSEEDRDRVFQEQLDRTGAGYFDFYLLHSIEDGNNFDTYDRLNCFEWGVEKKKQGLIRHFGFSFHGTPELLERVLDAHPEVEFVQIQLNYLDWSNQVIQSGRLYEILHSRGIPMVIMEPVKGGSLANFTNKEAEKILKDARPESSPASWALRFVASLDGVMTVLSGMSNEEQMKDNIRTITKLEPVTEKEKELLREVVRQLTAVETVQCTSCRYCTDGCPMEISIPDIFRALNTIRLYPNDFRAKNFYSAVTNGRGKASACVECGQCEDVCPQHLPIRTLLKEAAAKFE